MAGLSSLFAGISGLNSNGLALSVIGDNIANSNTIGFKASRANFGDILSQTLSGSSAMQVGRGTMILDVQKMFTQGTLESTNNPLDLAIEGDGFFIVRQINGPTFYTRAGQFRLDKEGYVVDPNGYRIQAYKMDPTGKVTGEIGDIYLAGLMSDPTVTTEIKMQLNLDSRQETRTWSFTAGRNLPDSSVYNYSTAITVYDSLGNPHLVYTYFVKTNVNAWEVHVITPTSNNPNDPNYPNYTEVGTFNLNFDERGRLTTNPPTTEMDFDFTPWGAETSTITLNFTDTTQYGSPNAVVFQTQNGYTAGNLIAVTVDQDGVVSGVFTNGQVKKVAQVALAKFIAPHNLTKVGNNLFLESYGSGGPTLGAPGTVGMGTIFANTLESSNVDLAEEFIRMIAAQRAYQANVRVITTTDNMLNELMNIVR